MNTETKNKEAIYDEQISPLMNQIIAICEANGIAMVANFEIPSPEDPTLGCATCLPNGDGVFPLEHVRFVKRLGVCANIATEV